MTPDKKEIIKVSEIKKFLKEIPPEQITDLSRSGKLDMAGRSEKRLINKLIFRKPDNVSYRRSRIVYKGLEDDYNGVGNNERMKNGMVIINANNYKHIK